MGNHGGITTAAMVRRAAVPGAPEGAFREAVLRAHVRNADAGTGMSAIRQVRAEVMRETGMSRAEFDRRMIAWARAADEAQARGENPGPSPALVDQSDLGGSGRGVAAPGSLRIPAVEGERRQSARTVAILTMTDGRGRDVRGTAPAGTADAGMRGRTRERYEAELARTAPLRAAVAADARAQVAYEHARIQARQLVELVAEPDHAPAERARLRRELTQARESVRAASAARRLAREALRRERAALRAASHG